MPKLPLENIAVFDFATILAGPVSSTFLADFGARAANEGKAKPLGRA